MTFRTLPIAAVALLALSACDNNQKAQEVTSVADDPQAAAVHNRPLAELPPAITADVTMRCKDNSLVYVTFFAGDKQVVVNGKTLTALSKARLASFYNGNLFYDIAARNAG